MRIVTAFIAVVLLGSAPLGTSLAQRGVNPPGVTVTSLEPLPRSGGEQRFRAIHSTAIARTRADELGDRLNSLRVARSMVRSARRSSPAHKKASFV